MASVIKSRTISSVVDNRIQLNNSSCARLWSADVGTTWTKIRVGCRISFVDSGSALGSTPRFAFGIQSGASPVFMDTSGPAHWLGIVTNTANWTRQAGPPYSQDISGYVGSGVAALNAATKIGTTLAIGSSLGSYQYFWTDATTANRTALFLDITKGSPNFTMQAFVRPATTGDVTSATYLAQIVLTTPAITNHTFSGSPTIAVNEATNGYFNAVGIAWDRSDALIELSDVTVVKLP